MESFQSPFVCRNVQKRLDFRIQNSAETIGNIEADRFDPADTIAQQAGDATGESHRWVNLDELIYTETPVALSEYNHCRTVDMQVNNQRPPLTHQYAYQDDTLYSNGTENMHTWIPYATMPGQSFGLNLTSATTLSNHPATAQNTVLRTFHTCPTTAYTLDHSHLREILPGIQKQYESVGTEIETIHLGDSVAKIGFVLENGRFACVNDKCVGITFARPAELRRHHVALHDANRPSFWCHVTDCKRNKCNGGKAFNRSDKLDEHMRKMHHNV